MTKEILIEVFKNKACSDDVTPNDYGKGAFSFWINKEGSSSGELVDIRILETLFKFFIRYENVSFEITKNEFDELFLIYGKRKNENNKIKEEQEKIKYNKNVSELLEMYKKTVSNQRKVLIEKNG